MTPLISTLVEYQGLFGYNYECGLPFPSPGDLPDPGIEPGSPRTVGRHFTSEPPEKSIFSESEPILSTFPLHDFLN